MAYTNIDDPSAYFQTVLWTGDGTAGNAVTFDGNSDMQPDFVWSKRRDSATSHVLKDTSRGGTSDNDLHLVSDLTQAESTYAQYRMDFDSDGFTLDGVGDSGFQGIGTSMVSWAWKCNGGTTSSNTDGSITSTVQANQDAGFSIITYTGNGTAGATFGHGLGVAPSMVIVKKRSATPLADSWGVWHQGLTSAAYNLLLNTNAAESNSWNVWNSTEPTSSVITVSNDSTGNYNGQPYVAYAFAEKQGYSKFGSYVGNGSTDGTFIYTGFKPAWVMTKEVNAAGSWVIYDNKRDTFNPETKLLSAEASSAESTFTQYDFVSNGFKFRTSGSENSSGNTHIYMAFAENPFTTSTGIPTTAR